MKRNEKLIFYLFLYVDDILMSKYRKIKLVKLKEILSGEFEMEVLDQDRDL